ncbi:MAG: hypothetical protein WDW36_003528 [Sanguina aurantia]
MEVQQQVQNFKNTIAFNKKYVPSFKTEDHSTMSHHKALQILGNGDEGVPYHATLRVVKHEGNRGPKLAPRVTQKHVGYTRNDLGSPYTA